MTFKDYAKSIVNSRPTDLTSPPLVVSRDALSEAQVEYVASSRYGNGPYVTYELGSSPVTTALYGNLDEFAVRLDAYVWQKPAGNSVAARDDIDQVFDLLVHAVQYVDEDEHGRLMTRNSFQRLAVIPPRLSPQSGKTLVGTLRFAYGVLQ